MVIALTIGWFTLGAVGGALFWWDWVVGVERCSTRCPSPRAILLVAVLSILGAAMLAAGVMITAIRWCENHQWGSSWWTRPICGKRD